MKETKQCIKDVEILNMSLIRFILYILFIVLAGPVFGQVQLDTLKKRFTLQNVIDLAVIQSSAVKYVQNRNVNYYWRYRNYKTRFMPQLVLSGDLPDYSHTTRPVTQPDGSIEFKQISNLEVSSRLAVEQYIPQIGTSIWARTSAVGIKNLKNNQTSFSGAPFSIGFSQPLFFFFFIKWYRKTEPMVYDQAQRQFIEDIEEIAIRATNRYFDYLKIQTNYDLAQSNLKNSQNNLKIAQTKKELGQISENDFSRIELSVLNAQKALNQASMDLKNADFELKSYIGLDQNIDIELVIPLDITLFDIDPQQALAKAKENRKETIFYERRLINADRELAEAKSSTGLRTELEGSYGLSQSADEFLGIYEKPEKDRTLEISFSIPILDWGRSASTVKLAETERELTIFDVNQDMKEFERSVVVQVEQFSLLKDQLKTADEADKVAESGYQIALKRFQNGELSITDLNIALQERESAKRDYIRSIEDYWDAYYRLRELTLYDFERNQNITYGNPMLDEELERYSF